MGLRLGVWGLGLVQWLITWIVQGVLKGFGGLGFGIWDLGQFRARVGGLGFGVWLSGSQGLLRGLRRGFSCLVAAFLE